MAEGSPRFRQVPRHLSAVALRGTPIRREPRDQTECQSWFTMYSRGEPTLNNGMVVVGPEGNR
jgi:hypothetical protein